MTAPWFSGDRLALAFRANAPEPGSADPLQLEEIEPEPQWRAEDRQSPFARGERALLYAALVVLAWAHCRSSRRRAAVTPSVADGR